MCLTGSGGTRHPASELSCPECRLNRDDAQDENKVRRHKKYYALSPEGKEAYEQDQSALFFQFAKKPSSYQAVHDAWMEIDKKFHLLE
jgi:DNA-binding PadR family transcriptional regulator